MWGNLILDIHGLHRKPLFSLVKKSLKGVWYNIAGVSNDLSDIGFGLENILRCHVRSGDKILFWKDVWKESRFLALYKLERRKTCLVSDRLLSDGVRWSWRTAPRSSAEILQLNQLLQVLSSFSVSTLPDSWFCPLSSDFVFQVAPVRRAIDSLTSLGSGQGIPWLNSVPIKSGDSNHEAKCEEWLKSWNCPMAKSYRAVRNVLPLAAKAFKPSSDIKDKCPTAIVTAQAALARTAIAKNLGPQPLPTKILVIGNHLHPLASQKKEKKVVTDDEDFLNLHELTSIDSISEPKEKKTCIILGTIKGIYRNKSWYYLECTSGHVKAVEKCLLPDDHDSSCGMSQERKSLECVYVGGSDSFNLIPLDSESRENIIHRFNGLEMTLKTIASQTSVVTETDQVTVTGGHCGEVVEWKTGPMRVAGLSA
ncbi:hypothetical protein L1887_23670 [Cichorium endivia]|nr:hypothetical protein L1887_23670 [Cichorium endivia]